MPRSQSITWGLPALRTYSAASNSSSSVALGPRFNKTGLPSAPTDLQEPIVLHVAGADLQDVGIAGHEFHVALRHDLGHHGQAGLGTGGGEDLQAVFLETLEAVRTGAGLERAAAEGRRPGGLHGPGGG